MAFLGLFLIAIGWFLQFQTKSPTLQKSFVGLFAVGALLLAITDFFNGTPFHGLLNVVIFVLAYLIYRRFGKSRRR